ncbi:RagB/SusD family nutrient uptake outer membrane protein [Tunicatimonas pelagia]|uniref:RagB/SusD family nutrient uptake outer membrane protein n=1 Tax=Tunicatimonas pelagia TaxID=931531 RepID=UPI0026670DB1|nr:RagB/SusD family nutrient uptake outer membrane protein [Tunicatimonas pelagia]WKN44977.1 RagB/SusD family nutrient uptake outer membrane protein [Tunicatimonas pelagia]
MKNINNILKTIVWSALVLTISACTDLEEEPVSELSPQVISDEKGVESIVVGGYAHLATSTLFGGNLNTALMVRSDMVSTYVNTSAERRGLDNFAEDDATGIMNGVWNFFFKTIASSNAAIAASENIEDVNGRNRIAGEARFIRALSYYHLVRLFGDVPYVDFQVSSSEGADGLNDLPREPVALIYDELIIPDFQFAKDNLPQVKNGGTRTRATQGTAAGYLSSVFLTLERYQEAYDEAKFVIDNSGAFGYRLEPNFQDLFNANQAASIQEPLLTVAFTSQVFDFPFQDDILPALTGIPIAGSFNGWGALVPPMEVYESFNLGDYRTQVSFQTEVVNSGGDTISFENYPEFSRSSSQPALPHVAKFRRFPGITKRPIGRETDNDYIAMRYAEVLLIAAEAANRLGNASEAIGYINQLRERARNADGVARSEPANLSGGLSGEELHEAIIEERRVELAFEFKRWYDIKRLRLGQEVFQGANSLDPQPTFTDDRYLFAIPANQLIFSRSWQQNPGY